MNHGACDMIHVNDVAVGNTNSIVLSDVIVEDTTSMYFWDILL
jgi:hypothetical protein